MSNRWTRKAQTARTAPISTDPLSRQLSQAVYDLRNSTIAKQLSGGDTDEMTMQALFKPIVATVAEQLVTQMKQGQAPKQEDVNSIMTDHLKQKLLQKQIEDLDRAGGGPANAPHDVMAFAKGAVDIQQGAAQTAIQMAELERQRRIETEEEMGGTIQAVRQEEQHKAAQQIEWMDKMYATVMGLTKEMSDQKLAFADQLHQSAIQSLSKQAEEAINRIAASSQEALSIKEQVHQKDLELLRHEFTIKELQQKSALPPNADPQYLHAMNYVQFSAAQQQRQLAREDAEHADKLETNRVIREELMPKGIDALHNLSKLVTGGGLSIDNPFNNGGAAPASAPGLGGQA